MVISFRLSGCGRSYHPPPPLPARAYAAGTPHAAASLEGPPPPPRPPRKVVSLVDCGNAAPLDLLERIDIHPVDRDLEPSFALNLFLDGYSIGDPGKGMLTYLIGDDPKKQPYTRASKALFSDIEYGCLPPEVLHNIPCKFLNGSTVCEVRDYRFLSNAGDYSGDDFPKVNRVSLRLGIGSVVKSLSSIVDASWTYHDQLIAESVVLNALHPRLNFDPTSCLEILCSSKKIDLGVDKGIRHVKDKSLYISADSPGNCKSVEFNVCKSRTVYNEDEALEGKQSGKLSSVLVNTPSLILINNAKTPADSDANDAIRSPYTLTNNFIMSDIKESASSIASEHLVQYNDLQAQVTTLQVDNKNRQPQVVTVVSQKRKRSSNLVKGRHESKKCSYPNKAAILNSQHSKGVEKSIGTSNKESLVQESHKVTVDQIIGGKDMQVKQKNPLSVQYSIHPCVDTIPGKGTLFKKGFKEGCDAPVVNLPNSAPEDLKERRKPSVISREAPFKPHMDKAGIEPKHTYSKEKVLGISNISLKQELKFRWKRLKNVDTLIKSPCGNTLIKSSCEDQTAEEPDVTGSVSSQLGVGLVVDNRRQQSKYTSGFHKPTDDPQYRKPIEFNIYKGTARCMENATIEGIPSVKFNNFSLNYAYAIHGNDVKSPAQSDPDNTIQSSKCTDSSASYDRMQSASKTVPNHLLKSSEQKAKVTVLPCKRNKSSMLLQEKHGSEIHIPPSKTARLISEKCIGLQNLAGTSNKQELELGSPKEMQVKVDLATSNKSMNVPQQLLCTSSSTCHPCIKQNLENINSIHVRLKEGSEAPVVDLDNSGMPDLRGSTTPSVKSFNADPRKASCKAHGDKTATKPQFAGSNREVSGTSTVSLNLDLNSKGTLLDTIDTQIKSLGERSSKPPCVNKSTEEISVTSGTSRELGTSPDLRLGAEHSMNTSEPDIEKILSEVILTTQMHGLSGKAARNDGLETNSSWIPSECLQPENTKKYPLIRDEIMSYDAIGRVKSNCKIRRITFHPSQYFSCKGIVDDSHYTLCLLESQAPDDHQITVGTIYGDDHMYIATLPTYCYAEKFVDQFILLDSVNRYLFKSYYHPFRGMKRDGLNLCDDKIFTGPSEITQQFEDVSQLCHETGEYAQYLMLSPSVVNSSAIEENNNVGCTFLNRLPDFHVDLLQHRAQHWVMTQPSQYLGTLESFFFNPTHSGGLQHTNKIVQHMGPSFACNAFALNLHQFPSQLSQQVSMDQYLQGIHDANNVFAVGLHQFPSAQLSQAVSIECYWQHRHGVPGFSDMYNAGTSASIYGNWRLIPTQLGTVVYQWDLPSWGRHINNTPLPHDGSSIPWSELQQIRSPQVNSLSLDSNDSSVTSTPVPASWKC